MSKRCLMSVKPGDLIFSREGSCYVAVSDYRYNRVLVEVVILLSGNNKVLRKSTYQCGFTDYHATAIHKIVKKCPSAV